MVAAICLFSSVSIAQDAAPSPAEPKPAKEKMICRSQVATGSFMTKRVCHTKAEWARINGANEQHTDGFRDRSSRGGMLAAPGD
ncbi:hypothetical protein RZN05_04535 [Sphingomonas sp. HF-S4]|uniref:YARHG domain-containing protein n=1 Tax=Sphingomonas agrestis TaxID=3080540 RepID=A0ABU3Y4B6_9SPHN|nr:hypothetical protein [Sphingomonas sp. HF-S4]MDV3456240.1 hypothetical protein [Sphingomonas sp. HF-S4]